MSITFNEKIGLNLLLPEALVDAYLKAGREFTSVAFKVADETYTYTDLGTPEDGYYKFAAPFAHAGDFTKLIEAVVIFGETTTVNKVGEADLTLLALAQAGVASYADNETYVNLFKAIYNYAAAANGATEGLYDLAVGTPEGEVTADRGEATDYTVSGISMLMGNSIGLRFKGTGATDNLIVKIGGAVLEAGQYKVKANGIDLFFHADYFDHVNEIEIYSGDALVVSFSGSVRDFAKRAAAGTGADAKTVAVATLANAFAAFAA
jgi:hypothetical protein